MPSLFPFDNAQVGDLALPAGVFLPGSACYTERGRDLATTTADGRIHYDRQAILRAATFALRGPHPELDSASGAPVTVTLRRGAVALVSFPGVVTAAYQARSHTTTVTIVGDNP
jgi:hypothetical protein